MTVSPAVFEDKCPTCIFRPGNPMHLRDGALRNVVEGNLQAGALLVCHETTFGQADREVMCRGFFDAYGAQTSAYQIMDRFGMEFEVVPNKDEEATDMTDDLRARALELLDLSEDRLTELEARPMTDALKWSILREAGRNAVLRELLGKDDREDEQDAGGNQS